MLLEYTTNDIMKTMKSFSIDAYPLLICLSVHQSQIDIVSIIQGNMSPDETLADLLTTREKFNHRAKLPYSKCLRSINTSNEHHESMPASVLKPFIGCSPTLQRIISDFKKSSMDIIRIDEVENSTWRLQYLKQKEMVDARLGHNQTEHLLFHGSPRSAAEGIIERGFDHKLIGKHGKLFESKRNHI
jgi:hypothetical protein